MTKKLWKITEISQNGVDQLAHQLGISLLLGRLLINRGITDPEVARAFLAPDLAQLHDPFQFRDMKRATERIARAIHNQEQILVYGDYDVDGITSIALIIRVLGKLLPGKLLYYIPKRSGRRLRVTFELTGKSSGQRGSSDYYGRLRNKRYPGNRLFESLRDRFDYYRSSLIVLPNITLPIRFERCHSCTTF